jgi:hypothetical protein
MALDSVDVVDVEYLSKYYAQYKKGSTDSHKCTISLVKVE